MKNKNKDLLSAPFVINTVLELPYTIIDINSASDEHFVFRFLGFDEGQTEYSVRQGGLTGKFGAEYTGSGMNCSFPCDITIGNVHDFLLSLENRYDCLITGDVCLQDYGTQDRTQVSFSFERKDCCTVSGRILNSQCMYRSGIVFSLDIDYSCIPGIIAAGDAFFAELYRLQKHSNYF